MQGPVIFLSNLRFGTRLNIKMVFLLTINFKTPEFFYRTITTALLFITDTENQTSVILCAFKDLL